MYTPAPAARARLTSHPSDRRCMLAAMPPRPRRTSPPDPAPCRLAIDEELVSDVLDHEGRYVAAADLRPCACGSPDGYELPGGQVTCLACMLWATVRDIASARRLRPPSRRPAAPPGDRHRRRGRRQAPAASG